jgi:hypothetical protein
LGWQASDALNRSTDFKALYKGLVKDVDRVVSGLLPFPEAVDPPGEVSPERRAEILADPRVQVSGEGAGGGPLRGGREAGMGR